MRSTYEMCIYSFDFTKKINDRSLNLAGFHLETKKGFFKTAYVLRDTITNKVIHSSTLYRFTPLSWQLFYFNYNVIGNCWTNEKYRGRGIYGKMVRYLVLNEVKKKTILFVENNNNPSINGLEKVGFKLIDKKSITRVFNFIALHKSIKFLV